MTRPPGLLEVGRTGRAHGVKGDISVLLVTDRTERLDAGARLYLIDRWFTVERSRPAGDRWLVHFEGIDDRNAAELISGNPLFAEPVPSSPDDLYVHQLVGAEVVGRDGASHGRCVAVVANPAHDLLELESGHLVPVVFVVEFGDGRIVIDPPEGLFDE